MADTNSSIFNQQARERLQSPDDLDKYVRVTSPSVWVVLAAILVLLGALLAWGIFGAVSTNVSTLGARMDGRTICLLDAARIENVTVGDDAMVGGVHTTVTEVSRTPISRDEARALFSSDFLAATLFEGDWEYVVVFEDVDVDEDVPLSVSITTERVSPISLVLG